MSYSLWVASFTSARTSSRLAALPDDTCRWLWQSLAWTVDKHGRFSADPDDVDVAAWPRLRKGPEETERCLQALAEVGLVRLYSVAGRRYLYLEDWEQMAGRVMGARRGKSEFPQPSTGSRDSRKPPETSGVEIEEEEETAVTPPEQLLPPHTHTQFGEGDGVSVEWRGRGGAPANPARWLEQYGRLHSKHRGQPYVAARADHGHAEAMLAALSAPRLRTLAEAFLRADDEYVRRVGYRVSVLRARINALALQVPQGPPCPSCGEELPREPESSEPVLCEHGTDWLTVDHVTCGACGARRATVRPGAVCPHCERAPENVRKVLDGLNPGTQGA